MSRPADANASPFSTSTLLDQLNATATDSISSTRSASPAPEQTGTGGSRPSSNPSSRKDSPRPLPKAPLSKEVAQRLLRNSTVKPVQRFDSADYFLTRHKEQEQQKRQSEQGEASEEAAVKDAAEAAEQPLAPPRIIDNRRRLSSPLKERRRTSSPLPFDDGGER